jgi:hypothetical protein
MMLRACVLSMVLAVSGLLAQPADECNTGYEVAAAASKVGQVQVYVTVSEPGRGASDLKVCVQCVRGDDGRRVSHAHSSIGLAGYRLSQPCVAVALTGRIHIVFAAEATDPEDRYNLPSGRGGIRAVSLPDASSVTSRSTWQEAWLAYNGTSVRHITPFVACDLDDQSPYRNHVYVVWVQENLRDGGGTNQINFTKSRNGGASFYVSNPNGVDGGAGFYLPFWRVSIGRLPVSAPEVRVKGPQDLAVIWEEYEHWSRYAAPRRYTVKRVSLNGGINWLGETRN